MCSAPFPPFHLPPHCSPLLQHCTHLNPSCLTSDSPEPSINSWKSLLCLAELLSAHYTKSSFVLLFACSFCDQFYTSFCLHCLVSSQIKKPQTCPAQELSACPVTCPSLPPSTNQRFSAAACRAACSHQYFLFSFSISLKNLPAAPPFKLFLFQTQGFSAVCADLCNSM